MDKVYTVYTINEDDRYSEEGIWEDEDLAIQRAAYLNKEREGGIYRVRPRFLSDRVVTPIEENEEVMMVLRIDFNTELKEDYCYISEVLKKARDKSKRLPLLVPKGFKYRVIIDKDSFDKYRKGVEWVRIEALYHLLKEALDDLIERLEENPYLEDYIVLEDES